MGCGRRSHAANPNAWRQGTSATGGTSAERGAVTGYRVVLAEEAAADLLRIEDFIIEPELASATPTSTSCGASETPLTKHCDCWSSRRIPAAGSLAP